MGGTGGLINPEDWSNLGFTNKTFSKTSVILSDFNTPPYVRKVTCKEIYETVHKSINSNRRKSEKAEKEKVAATAAVPAIVAMQSLAHYGPAKSSLDSVTYM